MRRIAIILGHPDPDPAHLCHALAGAYAAGARRAGHEVRRIDIAGLTFPWIKHKEDFENGTRPPDILKAQADILWAGHLVLVYPLWQGTMPALLKAFIEQVFRYDFAFAPGAGDRYRKLLTGRSARIVITMGMPAMAYRFYFLAHSLRSLERNVLGFAGIKPIRETFFGTVETADARTREKWLKRMDALGHRGR